MRCRAGLRRADMRTRDRAGPLVRTIGSTNIKVSRHHKHTYMEVILILILIVIG